MMASLGACVPDWPLPGLGDCPGDDCTDSSGSAASATSGPTSADPLATTDGPTTGGDAGTAGGDTQDVPGGDETGTSGEPEPPPAIGPHAVTPDYTEVNALLAVTATAEHADGVRMQIDEGESVELVEVYPGEFAGEIPAFTGADNDKHVARLTPWRGDLEGEATEVEYVIALPPPGYERYWQASGPNGHVAAVDVLPDGRPVAFGTFDEMGTSRCFLHLREKGGTSIEFVPVLPTSECRAIDFTIDRETGWMHLLVERKGGNGWVWWVGEMAAWGLEPIHVATGAGGDTALALARHPDMVAVCGSRTNDMADGRDALAVLLRPGEQAEARLFDYWADGQEIHKFEETARDCKFAGDTLVLVGEARGEHGLEMVEPKRDRLMVLEVDVITDDAGRWTVAGPGPNFQSRGLAVDVDEMGRYYLAGYTCDDDCVPDGEVRVYEPGGALAKQIQLGPLDSLWLGPHDIAWSPAGYAVIAFGEMQDQDYIFKVQAVAPDKGEPLWTFLPQDRQGEQLGLAVAVGPYGEIYAGGVGKDGRPAFAVIGG